ncbi:MAG: hypothetical protein H6622_04540 [Halobacteriovoraceae bacterium]|nr:hypothetical protein [Halobacteriovoraceae bacterium]
MKKIVLILSLISSFRCFAYFKSFKKLFDETVKKHRQSALKGDSKAQSIWEIWNERLKINSEINTEEAKIDKFRTEYETIASKIKRYNFRPSLYSDEQRIKLIPQLREKFSEIQIAQDNLKNLKKKVEDVHQKFKTAQKEYETYRVGKNDLPVDVISSFEKNAEKIMKTITHGNMSTKFLLNDIDQLATKAKLDSTTLDLVRIQSYKNLNETGIGKHVNSQIQRTLGHSCEIKKICTLDEKFHKPKFVGEIIENLLNSKENSPKIIELIKNEINHPVKRLGEIN